MPSGCFQKGRAVRVEALCAPPQGAAQRCGREAGDEGKGQEVEFRGQEGILKEGCLYIKF